MLFLSVAALTCLSSCGTEELEAQADALVVAPEPTPTPTPTPAPSPTGAPPPVAANVELAKVDSGINVDEWLEATPIPQSAAPDVVGAFRFVCAPSHFSYDDPIVHPGQPGAAHLHMFFGNTLADGNSTYESLRKTGDSTCTNVLNRSAYWMPALLDGQGSALVPNRFGIYYKRRPTSDGWFASNNATPVMIPRGLRYVFGNPEPRSGVKFLCVDGWNQVGTAGSMSHALSQCSPGQKLAARIIAPECWDGKNLDSEDHRSHVVYQDRDTNTGQTYCPASHPYVMPEFTISVEWTIASEDTTSLWRFSSDMDGAEPGSTLHADWFGAWEDSVMEMWHENCIEKLLNCSDADLGNGLKMKRNASYPSNDAATRKIPIHTIG